MYSQRANDTVSLLECRSNAALAEVTVAQRNEFVTVESQTKRGRGRPRHIDCSVVIGQADHSFPDKKI